MSHSALVQAYIGQTLRPQPAFAARLPGGIHFSDAPRKTRYPFLRGITSGGDDLTELSSGDAVIGGEQFWMLMVIDQADRIDRAAGLTEWIRASLEGATGAFVDVTVELSEGDPLTLRGWVSCRKETSISSPVWQQGMPFQQVGGTYRFWVDRQ
jgi:hypothetical protein